MISAATRQKGAATRPLRRREGRYAAKSKSYQGRTLSCSGLKDIVGACHRAIVMKHCPASCGLCEDPEYLERHLELANMYGEVNHRQLKKIC